MVATRNYYCVVKEASLKKKTSRFPSSVITNTEYRNTIYIPETDILRYDQALQLLPALLRNRFLFSPSICYVLTAMLNRVLSL